MSRWNPRGGHVLNVTQMPQIPTDCWGLNGYDESIATDCRGFSPYPLWDGIHVDEQVGIRKYFFCEASASTIRKHEWSLTLKISQNRFENLTINAERFYIRFLGF